MIEQKKQWLLGVSWDSVVNVNRTLCQAQKLEPQINQKSHTAAQRRWEQASSKPVSLMEAFDSIRAAFDQSPFTFNNGNTFATVARGLVEDALRSVPAVEAQILRSTIGHYVAGTISRKELAEVLTHLAPLLLRQASPAPAAAPASAPAPAPAPAPTAARPATATSAPADVASPRLGEARPVVSS